jgi:predicted patatin/cPLA2 family phospholipase
MQSTQNSVIKNLQARRGMHAPFNDEKKIGLVLSGGMMTGINGAGAMCALQALGLAKAFDVIYTASAGFPNASYLLSENTEVGSSVYYEEFSGNRFINFWRFWEPVSVDWAVHCTRDIKPIEYKKLWDCGTELFLRVIDSTDQKKRIYLDIKQYPESVYFNLLRASISAPFITEGVQIGLKKFYDGHVTNRDVIEHIQFALAGDCTDVLIIYNQEIQRDLLSLPKSEKYFEITPAGHSKIGKFETRAHVLKKAHSAMKEQVLKLLK